MPQAVDQTYQSFVHALHSVYDMGEAKSIARIVFEDVFGVRNTARKDDLSDEQLQQLQLIQKRLLQNEPIQYILEQADFYGYQFKVSPAVLIPRQETEELVAWLVEIYKDGPPLRLLDIGTGSGCIAISLKKQLPQLTVFALDKSATALAIAKENARVLEAEVHFMEVDILDESNWADLGSYDIIVSNPPYIPREETALMPQNVLAHEPQMALFVDHPNALLFYETIGRFALQQEVGKGNLFVETNEHNAGQLKQLFGSLGLIDPQIRKDMQGKDRMIRSFWKNS